MPATAPPTSTAPGFAPRRSTDDRILLGLCAGLARQLGTSATAVRIAVLLLSTLLLPLMLLAYAVTSLLLPADDGSVLLGDGPREQRDVLWAVVISTLAATCVLGSFGDTPLSSGWMFWVLAPVAGVAAAAVWWRDRDARATNEPATWTGQWSGSWDAGGHSGSYSGQTGSAAAAAHAPAATAAAATATPEAPAPSAPAGTPDGGETFPAAGPVEPPTLIKDAEPTRIQDGPPQPPSGDGDGPGDGGDGGHEPPFGEQPPSAPQPSFEPPKPKVRRRSLALPVIAGMALIPAVATVLAAAGAIAASATTVAIVLGLMALVATIGAVAVAVLRPSYLGAVGLLLIAAFTGLLSIGTAQFGDLASDGLGERTYQPSRTADLSEPFVLGAGELTLDLRDLRLAPRQRVTTTAELGFGQLNVIVPRGVRVVNAPGSDAQGLSVRARANGASVRESTNAPTIELDIDMRGGDVRVLAGNAARSENLEVLAQQAVGFWSDQPERRP